MERLEKAVRGSFLSVFLCALVAPVCYSLVVLIGFVFPISIDVEMIITTILTAAAAIVISSEVMK